MNCGREHETNFTTSSSCFPCFNSFLVCTQINVSSTPGDDSLHKYAFFFPSFHIADYVDPGSHFQIMSLDTFENMDDVDICCFCRAGCGVVVLQSKGRFLNHIFINAATISSSSSSQRRHQYQPRKRTFVPCAVVLRSLSRTRFDATGTDISSDVVFMSCTKPWSLEPRPSGHVPVLAYQAS